MTDTPAPDFPELMRFMRLLDNFPQMSQDTRARLFLATIGADNENERQVYWATVWCREAAPGLTVKSLVFSVHRMLPLRTIPTSDQIIFALKAHADKKENAA